MSRSVIVFLCCLIGFSSACKVSSSIFQTEDGIVVSQIAFVAEFSLSCPNEVNSVQYAEVAGRLSPIVRIGDKYQVSWSEDIKKARSEEIRLFDEEGYAAVRKAQRSGENTQNIKPLATIPVKYSGAYTGSFINSEFVATFVIGFFAYVAFSSRSKLVS